MAASRRVYDILVCSQTWLKFLAHTDTAQLTQLTSFNDWNSEGCLHHIKLKANNVEERFFGKLGGTLNIIILPFCKTLISLFMISFCKHAYVFWDAWNATNSFFAEAPPWTPLNKLTMLPPYSIVGWKKKQPLRIPNTLDAYSTSFSPWVRGKLSPWI